MEIKFARTFAPLTNTEPILLKKREVFGAEVRCGSYPDRGAPIFRPLPVRRHVLLDPLLDLAWDPHRLRHLLGKAAACSCR